MKADALTCLTLAAAAAGLVAVASGGRSSGRRRHKEVFLGENSKFKFGGRIDYKLKKQDSTKTLLIKTEQLLRIEEHDFAMRPGFGGAAIPVGIDVQVESIDSISEVNMDFTMTLYLRHYWKDERLAFPSRNNQSRTFDSRLVKKIWVPDVFFAHSKRSFIHDTTMENIMLRVYPDGNILYSVRVTVTSLCSMDFSSFPLDSQNCSLELESYAYNENDLMLYWKNGNDSLRTDEIVLSQFFIEHFQPSSGLAFYSSTDVLPHHADGGPVLGLLLDRPQGRPCSRLSGYNHGAHHVHHHHGSLLLHASGATSPKSQVAKVSYVKAVDIYLWTSFLFVFLSVIEYAAVNYCTTLEEMRKMRRGKLPSTFDASQAMAFDGCFHDNDMELTPFPRAAQAPAPPAPPAPPSPQPEGRPSEGTRLRRQRSLRENVDFLLSNSYMIDSYSRLAFPLSYLLFNTIYWSLYS
ncbi:gamma-aminobutyric acid receptor subunit rho-3-like isoform X8 [Syngnathoides biaculeatus]|uniref:gamma-aminobutyric acid receptor subunit rho-3-like isoform X8 n=1 Tax=Syngnathoides biaculeatus TaxID=300417 RepID=UPI002ADE144E|nr:gamma-aminobutyric acid receptor subunit rho-3-like isoform X8 [Syngnathoides biaculeatus]